MSNTNRIEQLKLMHELIRSIDDETFYFEWIETFPDEPSEDDFVYIANDYANFMFVCNEFKRIINNKKVFN